MSGWNPAAGGWNYGGGQGFGAQQGYGVPQRGQQPGMYMWGQYAGGPQMGMVLLKFVALEEK